MTTLFKRSLIIAAQMNNFLVIICFVIVIVFFVDQRRISSSRIESVAVIIKMDRLTGTFAHLLKIDAETWTVLTGVIMSWRTGMKDHNVHIVNSS